MNICLRVSSQNLSFLKKFSPTINSLRLKSDRNIFDEEPTEKLKVSSLLDADNDDFTTVSTRDSSRLVKVKAYKPPPNVEEQIKNLCQKTLGQEIQEKNLKKFKLTDSLSKFKVLTSCISNFKHDIPNSKLNEIQSVQDLINYYLTEQKDTSSLEDLAKAENLPPNLHVNLEYNRFDPQTDTFFEGKDAFPNRDTLTPSLWYSKKYKPVIKQKEMFNK